jgi:hypothetical protein
MKSNDYEIVNIKRWEILVFEVRNDNIDAKKQIWKTIHYFYKVEDEDQRFGRKIKI